jgi:hypothetical protein
MSCVLIFFGFCGKRLLLTISDICDGILELKNMLGCGEGMICSFVNSQDFNSKSKCPLIFYGTTMCVTHLLHI